MKKLMGFVAVTALLVSLSVNINFTDSAMDETYPRPTSVELV